MVQSGENYWRNTFLQLLIACLVVAIFLYSPPLSEGSFVETGTIYGYTYQVVGWDIHPIPYAIISSEDHTTVSNILGYYSLSNLTFDHEYMVTASKCFYKSDSSLVILHKDQPSKEVNFLLIFGDATINSFTELTSIQQEAFLTDLSVANILSENADQFL